MAGPRHSDQTDTEGLHKPKDFDAAPNETALIKNETGNIEYRSLSVLGDTGPQGTPGTTLLNITVVDINNASPELASQSGASDGDIIFVHQSVAGDANPVYLYQWDTSIGVNKNDPPFTVPGDGGTWVNKDIYFFQGRCSSDQLETDSFHGRIYHVNNQGRWYGIHAGGDVQLLTRVGFTRSNLPASDINFHDEVDDRVKTKTLSSNTTLTFSGYQLLDEAHLEIQSASSETLAFPSFATIEGKYDVSGVVNFIACKINDIGTQASGTITVTNNAIDAGDFLTIAGISVTEGIEWEIGSDIDETAFNICRAFSEKSGLMGVITSTVSSGVITITAYAGGVAGNSITMTESDGATDNFTLSGAILSGGVDGEVQVKITQANNISITELQAEVDSNASGSLHHNISVAITTTTISLPFNTITTSLDNVSINVGTDEFTINTSKAVIFHMEPQFARTTGGGTETIVVWYEISTDGGSSFVKGESILVELQSGDSVVSPLTALIRDGSGNILRFRAQGTSSSAGLEFSATAAGVITSDHPIVPAYILTIR